jgi:hypothetical protein
MTYSEELKVTRAQLEKIKEILMRYKSETKELWDTRSEDGMDGKINMVKIIGKGEAITDIVLQDIETILN